MQYLDADITVNATLNNNFAGTFDGNGHTITISVPLSVLGAAVVLKKKKED